MDANIVTITLHRYSCSWNLLCSRLKAILIECRSLDRSRVKIKLSSAHFYFKTCANYLLLNFHQHVELMVVYIQRIDYSDVGTDGNRKVFEWKLLMETTITYWSILRPRSRSQYLNTNVPLRMWGFRSDRPLKRTHKNWIDLLIKVGGRFIYLFCLDLSVLISASFFVRRMVRRTCGSYIALF